MPQPAAAAEAFDLDYLTTHYNFDIDFLKLDVLYVLHYAWLSS